MLLAIAASISRDYQDTWILEGLEIPFSVLMATFLIYFYYEKKISWLLLFSCLLRFAIVALPNLKYSWYLGIFPDPNIHFSLTKQTILQGHVPSIGYARFHGHVGTPFMYLSFDVFSLITGSSVVDSFKFLPVILSSLFPLFVYSIAKTTELSKRQSMMKYVMLLSSIPVMSSTSYEVWGTMFGSILTLVVLSQLLRIMKRYDSLNWIILVVFSFTLASAHSVSSVLLCVALFMLSVIVFCFPSILGGVQKIVPHLKMKTLLWSSIVISMMSLAWLSLVATPQLIYGVQSLARAREASQPPIGSRNPYFTGLNFADSSKLYVISRGGAAFSLFLIVAGILILIKKLRRDAGSELRVLSLYVIILFMLLSSGLVLGIGLQWFDRVTALLLNVFPIYAGIALYYLKPTEVFGRIRLIRLAQLARILVICTFVLLAIIELYHAQMLVPSASSAFRNLPVDQPLIYIGQVNSAYQRHMIWFAEEHIASDKKLASDPITEYQAIGLANYNFSAAFPGYQAIGAANYNFSADFYSSQKSDYLLIHLPGKSGSFTAYWFQADACAKELIVQTVRNSSILYTNGESFILSKPR